MHRFCILFSLLLLSNRIIPQSAESIKFEYKVSKPYGVIDAMCKDYLSDGKELLLVKSDHVSITFQKFNIETLELVALKEFKNLPYFSTEAVIKCKDKFYFFYSVWDKPNITEQLFVKEIDIKSCDFSSEGTLVLKVKGHIKGDLPGYVNLMDGPSFGMSFGTKFNIRLSNDESKILVHYRIRPEEKNDNLNYDIIGAYVYDNSYNKLRGQEYKMPYSEAKMDNVNYMVTNSGDIFMLVSIVDAIEKKTEAKIGHYELFKCNEDPTENISSTNFALEDVYFNLSELYEDPLNKVVSLGHHNTENTVYLKGLSYVKTNPNGKLIDTKTFKIPSAIAHQYEKKPSEEEGIPYLRVNSRVNCMDSSMLVFEEQYHSYTYNSGTAHYYNDILVSKIASYGKLEWVKRIKRHAGVGDMGGLSYVQVKNNDYQYVIFLDDIKNLEDLEKNKVGDKSVHLIACRISNKTGETERIPLFNITNINGKELLQFSTKRFCQVTDNDVIFEAYNGIKQDVLIKIHLE
jgi:hypothetical protein